MSVTFFFYNVNHSHYYHHLLKFSRAAAILYFYPSALTISFTNVRKLFFTFSVVSITSSWLNGWSRIPAAILEIQEMPSTSKPECLATITSGTVDIPTASPPNVRANLTSAGV